MTGLKIATVGSLGVLITGVITAKDDKKNELSAIALGSAVGIILLATNKDDSIRSCMKKGAKGMLKGE